MRTLKKTLSLVLVVAMVLGLCVVGASAYNKVEDFTDDVSKIGTAYYEAVGVLTGIGVIDGMTETAFEPQGTYTREQAAKIIAYMMLGKDKADSLGCTVAPFEDVAANRWSAGYIAFCVEQGIIDGMTETTFEPTGTLTGFQWAKMLLCAVGFGVNDEFTGSSWSVNTAKVAHTVDLFAGDLAGADHVALRREQAALYAFNVLTNVKKVAYSANVTSYVYGIRGYWTVDGIGHTLATDVYKLYNVVGIVVDSEGLGAPATVVNVKGNYTVNTAADLVSVVADTDIDMMYHAARIWYVAGTKANTGVFTLDLAKTETTNCPSKLPTTNTTYPIGVTGQLYQLDAVDNSAIDAGKVNVAFYYSNGTLGVRSTVNNTTVVNGEAVKNANINTDISKINNGDPIIYLKGKSTTSNNYGWYVYAPSATTGTVKAINNANSSITLTDGTVLAKSNLATSAMWNDIAVGASYTFVLDTHGHWMSWQGKYGVSYYTGTVRDTNSHDAWWGEAEYVAQFVNVTTGEISEVPVISSWLANARIGGYYDLKDVLYGTNKYNPVKVTANPYGSYYFDASETLNAKSYKIGSVYYNPDTVTFLIATGKGSNLKVTPYVGFDALLAAYNKTGAETAVTLENIAMTCVKTAAGNPSASVIFAYDGIASTAGGFLFVPSVIDSTMWIQDVMGGYVYNGVYLNGAAATDTLRLANKQTIYRGFYSYVIDANTGYFTLTKLTKDAYVYDGNAINMASDASKTVYYLSVGTSEYNITDWTVVDLRTGAGVVGGVDKIISVADLVLNNNTDYFKAKVQLAFVPSVGIIYVVDRGTLNTISISVDAALSNWTVTPSTLTDLDLVTGTTKTVVLKHDTLKFNVGDKYTVNYTVYQTNGTTNAKAATATVNKDGNLEFDIKFTPQNFDDTKIVIDSIPVELNVSLQGNGAANFSTTSPVKGNLGEVVTVVAKRSDVYGGAIDVSKIAAKLDKEGTVTVPATLAEDNRTVSFSYTLTEAAETIQFWGVNWA